MTSTATVANWLIENASRTVLFISRELLPADGTVSAEQRATIRSISSKMPVFTPAYQAVAASFTIVRNEYNPIALIAETVTILSRLGLGHIVVQQGLSGFFIELDYDAKEQRDTLAIALSRLVANSWFQFVDDQLSNRMHISASGTYVANTIHQLKAAYPDKCFVQLNRHNGAALDDMDFMVNAGSWSSAAAVLEAVACNT